MSARDIYIQLLRAGLTPAGACGLMGNMQAESNMKSNIAQRGMTTKTDEEYTYGVDSGAYDGFTRDAVGYGLCQWTYYTRKAALLAYARNTGASIGDETMQVGFCIKELRQDYPGLWALLCSTIDVYTAASEVCTVYERPAVNNISVRAGFANQFYSRFSGLDISEGSDDSTETKAQTYWPPRVICEGMTGDDVAVAQAILKARGGDVVITGEFDARFKTRVMQWQNFNGLAADGIIGAATWAALLSRR